MILIGLFIGTFIGYAVACVMFVSSEASRKEEKRENE